jgi:cyanophycinase
LSDRYAGTFLENELRALLQRGGALGGTSAGAAICSKTMISEGICDPEFKTGFGFLPEIIIDQHFAAKNRFERLRKAVQIHPGLAGLGIDESTGLLLRGETATVLGEGKVHWYQAQDANPTFEVDSANAFGADREWSDGQAISIHEIAASPR